MAGAVSENHAAVLEFAAFMRATYAFIEDGGDQDFVLMVEAAHLGEPLSIRDVHDCLEEAAA